MCVGVLFLSSCFGLWSPFVFLVVLVLFLFSLITRPKLVKAFDFSTGVPSLEIGFGVFSSGDLSLNGS